MTATDAYISRERRFEQFVDQREKHNLNELVEGGNAQAESFSEIIDPSHDVLAYYGNDPDEPKGFIVIDDDGVYRLIIANIEHTGDNDEELETLERILFDWMISEDMISL